MLESQRIQLRLSEIRKAMADMAAADELSEEQRSEVATLRAEYTDCETRYQAALVAEDTPEPETREETPEEREIADLRRRSSLATYVLAARDNRPVGGPEADYNAAMQLGADQFPLQLLAGDMETRATTDTETATRPQTWLDRLFADTAAMRLGITMPSVEPGVPSYPVTTAGPAAAQRARGESAVDAPWAVGVTEVKPTRNAVHLKFTYEDAARLPGLEEALRRDMAAALAEGIDRAIFVGDAGAGGANADPADIVGLTTAAITEHEITQANKVKGPETLDAFLAAVDGVHAGDLGGLNVVTAIGAYRLWERTIVGTASETQKSLARFLRDAGLSWTTRGLVEDNTAAGDFAAFVGRPMGAEGAGVAPVWTGAQLIRDPYTQAAEGEVLLTLTYLWGFALPRPASYQRIKFVA